jgi:iron-sulfur cluster insertion protein
MSDTATMDPAVGLSASAARRLRALIEAEGRPGLMLRLTVSGGGCSGFQYGFSFDEALTDEDRVFERDGVKLVVDEVSLTLLGGAEVDYVEELVGASFQVKNPNAKSSCGCGSSFAV